MVRAYFNKKVSIALLVSFLLPVIAFAQTETFTFEDPLNNQPLVCALKGFIGGIYLIGTPVAALAIAYVGFLFVYARGNAGALADARTKLVHVLLGVFLFFGSWLLGITLVNTANSIIPGLIPGIASC